MKVNLDVRQGSTFNFVFRWETAPIVYKPITGILAQAPVRLTVVGHDLVDGWRAAVSGVRGMTQINAKATPPKAKDYHPVTVVGPDTIEFNDVDAAVFSAYISGGFLQYNTPVDLVGFTARMKVRDRVGGTELLLLTNANGRIAIDDAAKTITLNLPAADTEALTFSRGVYDLELVSPSSVVTAIAQGAVRITKEITTPPP